MSDVDKMLSQTTAEMEQAKRVLQDLSNEVVKIAEITYPALQKQVETLRSARMAVVNEIRESLTAFREIRKFFLEEAHQVEMAELERFIKVCRELQALKREGVLDAVGDTVLRLALAEPETKR